MRIREEYKRNLKAARQLAATFNPQQPIATDEQAQALYDLRAKIQELIADPEKGAEDRAHTEITMRYCNAILAHLNAFKY